MPGLFHAGGASGPASFTFPLEPLEPEEPLDPEEPLEPLEPEEPLDPDVPLVPLAPEEPLVPLAPDDPLVPPTGSVPDRDVPGPSNSSFDPAPPQAMTRESTLDATTTAAARDFMTAELYRAEARCPTPTGHERDSLTSPSVPPARS
jgi:hypothetical protein